jgi:hypothetical protein
VTVGDVQPGDVIAIAGARCFRIEWRCRGGGVFARRWSAEAWTLAGVGGDTAHVYLPDHEPVLRHAPWGVRPEPAEATP